MIDVEFFERLAAFGLERDVPIVHDNAYSEITFDGYTAPSFLQAPGATRGRASRCSRSRRPTT